MKQLLRELKKLLKTFGIPAWMQVVLFVLIVGIFGYMVFLYKISIMDTMLQNWKNP